MKKRTLALIMCAGLAVCMTGCGSENGSDSVTDTETEAEAVESTESEDSLVYNDTIVYDPSEYVTLGDYSSLEVTVEGDYEVTDDDVKESVESQISQALTQYGPYYVGTDKTNVENGDVVNIDYVGTRDGEEFEGGSATGYNLEIGSGSFIDGFEEGLVGANVGDNLDLNLTFPEDYQNEDLAGAEVVFNVTVNGIMQESEMSYDLLNDDYASTVMGYDTKDAYLEAVKTNLADQAESSKTTDTEQAILSKLVEISEVSGYPEGLEDERVAQQLKTYENYASAYGMDMDSFLSAMGTTAEDFEAQIRERIPESMSQEMILLAIADKEGITDDEDAYKAYVENIISVNGFTDEAQLYSMYGESYVKRMYRQESALNLVVDQTNVTYAEAHTEPLENTETVEDTEK